MKKRLLALILAGLLTASFASCVAEDIDTGDGSTVDLGSTSGDPVGGDDTPSDEYVDVDMTLFTLSDADLLTATDDSAETLTTIPAESEVHCTKRNATWCYVSYNGQEGYIARKRVTEIDILGKNFTPVEGGEKIMYVNTKVNVRRYPSSELEGSDSIGKLEIGTAVTVISTNDEWSRIEYQTEDGVKYYFVFSEYLSEDKQVNPNDPSQWAHLFAECNPHLTLYTTGNVNLREWPDAEADLIKTIPTGSKVTVTKQATIGETSWSFVSVEIESDKDGDDSYYVEGYMVTSLLAPGASTSSLDEIVATYTGITKLETETTMYTAAENGVNVRSTPDFTSSTNKVGTLEHLQEATVVAGGTYNGASCYVIKFTVNEQEGFYFVSANYLTIYEDGTPMLTLDTIRSTYTKFTVLAEENYRETTIKELANCYLTPEVSENSFTKLNAGTTVEVVAEETGSVNNAWLVVKTADGALYFVFKSKVN